MPNKSHSIRLGHVVSCKPLMGLQGCVANEVHQTRTELLNHIIAVVRDSSGKPDPDTINDRLALCDRLAELYYQFHKKQHTGCTCVPTSTAIYINGMSSNEDISNIGKMTIVALRQKFQKLAGEETQGPMSSVAVSVESRA